MAAPDGVTPLGTGGPGSAAESGSSGMPGAHPPCYVSRNYYQPMDDVIDRLRAAAAAVLVDEPVPVAYLYGSRARGDARAGSDVDVALLMPNVSPRERFEARLRVGVRLSAALGAPDLDLTVLEDLPLRVAGQVIRDGVVIHTTDEAVRAEYESRIFREATDFAVLGDALDDEILRLTARGAR